MTYFGKNIRKIRSIQKLSQQQFAEIFELSRASIGAYEEGRAEPKLDVINRIANYFSISVDSLINNEITVNELYHFNIFDAKISNQVNIGTELLKNMDFSDIPLVITHDLLLKTVGACISESESSIKLPGHSSDHLAVLIDESGFTYRPEHIQSGDIIIIYGKYIIESTTDLSGQLWIIKINKKLYLGEIKSLGRNSFIFFPEEASPITLNGKEIDVMLPIETLVSKSAFSSTKDTSTLKRLKQQVNDLYNRL
jgi:transcriptional regulator with XRE-family HTH domain